jgi:hypothetical protein
MALASVPWLRAKSMQPKPAAKSRQGEFAFGEDISERGYLRWVENRRVAAKDLACRLNLPLGRPVEVWLCGGVRLRGTLKLKEEVLFIEEDRVRHLELAVGSVEFTYREIESCVRLD